MRTTYINGRWPIKLPDHRADFHDERPWWEAARLADMYAWTRASYSDKKGGVLIDVGSEEGDLTALFASWGWNVAFIDPSQDWIKQTHAIFAENGLTPGPSFIGLADNVFKPGTPVTEARFVTIDEPAPRMELDRFANWLDRTPDAVTMDVEGSELRVLEGATQLLKEDVVWWISVHDADPHAAMPSKVHELMRDHGYDDQFLAYDHEFHYRFFK